MNRTIVSLAALAVVGLGTATPASAATTTVARLAADGDAGIALTGTKTAGTTSPTDAPTLQVGEYLDEIPVAPAARYYRVKRSPGATLYVSLASRPAVGAEGTNETWSTALETLQGNSCGSDAASRGQSAADADPLVTAAVDVASDSSGCGEANDFVLTIKRTEGVPTPATTSIRVIEVPAVANLDSFPPAEAQAPPQLRPPVAPEAKPVDGGAGFTSATEVTTGTYLTQAAPGQLLFFKAHLDEGQRATFAVDGPTPDFTAWSNDYSSMTIAAVAYNPMRDGIWSQRGTYTKTSLDDDQFVSLPAVHYRNREGSSDVRGVSVAGDYYFTVVVPRDRMPAGAKTVPVKFSVRLEGESTTGPQYVKGVVPTDTASPKPSSYEAAPAPDTAAKAGDAPAPAAAGTKAGESSGGIPGGVWAGLGLAGLAVLGGLAYAITRTLTAGRRS